MEDNKTPENLFKGIGIDEKKALETTKNKDLTESLRSLIYEGGAEHGCEKSAGLILYTLATRYPANAARHRALLAKFVVEKKVTNTNLNACLDYLKKIGAEDLDVEAFKVECGVGVSVSKEQITEAVRAILNDKREEVLAKRYRTNVGLLLQALRNSPATKFADGKVVSEELDAQLKALLGPRTAEDDKPQEKKKEEKPVVAEKKPAAKTEEEDDWIPPQESIRFPAPEENTQQKPQILNDHLSRTGNKIHTRFPPEPNGYLHIGHAKAMHLNFGYAKKNGGNCYLRFDDTNPEKEDLEYFNSIIDNAKWMGWEPWKVTYSSAYFPQLYDLAVELIKRGKAYVCHETKEQMQAGRNADGGKPGRPSPYRDRSVEENLRLFEDMRKGKYAENAAVLRMKGDMSSPNPNMRDLVAYRIKFAPHPVAGDVWCIYPSYDFTHCLVDSLEDITHSLCTLEFESRREPYNWLIDQLDLYRPVVWEYSRLNLSRTVLSKRKLIFLVKEGIVRGWDDPRMSTIYAYRRKGYTSTAINMFCEKIGVTRAPNLIPITLLEQCLRLDLDPKVNRAMCVIHPLRVVITNIPEGEEEQITIANHPYEDKGKRQVPFARVLYIEKTDFRLEDEKGYFGLAPNKEVLLKYAYNIKCTHVVKGENGEVVELHATVDKANTNKCKGVLHWVAESKTAGSPVPAEVRLYDHLFKSENPNELGAEWLNDINPNSLVTIPHALCDVSMKGVKPGDKFQFERHGFFCVDLDTTADKVVFNRSVTLKESKTKAPAAAKPSGAVKGAKAQKKEEKK